MEMGVGVGGVGRVHLRETGEWLRFFLILDFGMARGAWG